MIEGRAVQVSCHGNHSMELGLSEAPMKTRDAHLCQNWPDYGFKTSASSVCQGYFENRYG